MHALKSLIAVGVIVAAIGTGAGTPMGTITRIESGLQLRQAQSPQWQLGKLGHIVSQGDWVRTSPKGRAEISYRDGTIARLGPMALLHLDQFRQTGRTGWGRFLSGSVWLKIAKGSRAEIVTPAAVATVVGTEFVLDVAQAHTTTIVVLEGGVDFTGTLGDTVRVNGGFWGKAVPGERLQPPQPITPDAVQLAKTLSAPLAETAP